MFRYNDDFIKSKICPPKDVADWSAPAYQKIFEKIDLEFDKRAGDAKNLLEAFNLPTCEKDIRNHIAGLPYQECLGEWHEKLCDTAAKGLTKVMKNALKSAGEKITPRKTDADNAEILWKLRQRVDKARYKRDDYGAGDTEPRVVMLDVFENYLKLYLDAVDFPLTYEQLYY